MERGELLYNKLRRRFIDLEPFEKATDAARLAFSEVENEVMNEVANSVSQTWREREASTRTQVKGWYDAYCALKAQQVSPPEDPRVSQLQMRIAIETRAFEAERRKCWKLEDEIQTLKQENRRLGRIQPTNFKAEAPHTIFFVKPEFFPHLTDEEIFRTRSHDPLEDLSVGVKDGLVPLGSLPTP